jgi:hypothetical protein
LPWDEETWRFEQNDIGNLPRGAVACGEYLVVIVVPKLDFGVPLFS